MKKRKRFILYWLILCCATVAGQRVEKDIFDNLQYKAENGRYEASFEKNVFGDWVFSDGNRNKVTFEKKYLEMNEGRVLESETARRRFFRDLIRRYGREWEYEAVFAVDVFGKVVIKDNRDNRLEAGTDIFGNPTYEEQSSGRSRSVRKDLSGRWIYRSDDGEATLKKDILGKWLYRDSRGNEVEFSERAWESLLYRQGSEERVFLFLVGEFLLL